MGIIKRHRFLETMVDATPSKSQLVSEFINEHVLRHASDHRTWNLPFAHVPWLDWLRYDWGMMLVAVIMTVGLAAWAARRHRPVPHGWSNVFEAYVLFIRDQIAIPSLGPEEGRRLTSYFCSLLFFILTLNMFGLLPCCTTPTGNVGVTCAMAVMFLVLAFGLTIYRRGVLGFLKAFVPGGAPGYMLPILVPIEVISVLSRAFALMVRLFANMLAGHIIILAMLGMIVTFGMVAFLPVTALVVALFFFEIFVAVFQAYIFTLLSAIFTGLLLNPEH
jgi:F-type H+-transporting ATPase subunit a